MGRVLLLCWMILFAFRVSPQTEDEGLFDWEVQEELRNTDGLGGNWQPLLQPSADRFTQTSRFEFSQLYFNNRGLDRRLVSSYFNGFPMNDPFQGGARWQLWSSLYDWNRDGRAYSGPRPDKWGASGAGGSEWVEASLDRQRSGTHLRASVSNLNVQGSVRYRRIGYSEKRKYLYGVQAGVGAARSGYREGTPRRDTRIFLGVRPGGDTVRTWEAVFIHQHSFRSGTSPLTEETARLAGATYNPNWGLDEGRMRSAAPRSSRISFGSFRLQGSRASCNWELGWAGLMESNRRGRLGYRNAPSPRPDYYRYLPSYYMQRSFYPIAGIPALEGAFLQDRQIDWKRLRFINSLGGPASPASYFLYDQVVRTREGQFSARISSREEGTNSDWSLGLNSSWTTQSHFGELIDTLGAPYVLNSDSFSGRSYDLYGEERRRAGDRFQHDLKMNFAQLGLSAYLQKRFGGLVVKLAGRMQAALTRRDEGLNNALFPESSGLPSQTFRQWGAQLISTLSWRMNHRNYLDLTLHTEKMLLPGRQLFPFPEYSSRSYPILNTPFTHALDLTYHIRWPELNGRISGFGALLSDERSTRIQYVRTVEGAALVNEFIYGLGQVHVGLEGGVDWEVIPDVTLYTAFSLGDYRYSGSARGWLYPLPGIETTNQADWNLGTIPMEGIKVAGSPQRAWSMGVYLRHFGEWRVGLSMNHFSGNYLSPSLIRRSELFVREWQPLTKTDAALERSRFHQELLPSAFLIRASIGRSFRSESGYYSLYFSVSNLLNESFRTGGFEQGRLGSLAEWAEDRYSGHPVFGPRFWYGPGRTFSISLRYSHP